MIAKIRTSLMAIFFVACVFGTAKAQVSTKSPSLPTKSGYLIGAMYFGGWDETENRSPWDAIRPFPDRTPILGYYDGASPEVADLEIKWALENGVDYFVYCWYRRKENVGKPVSVEKLFIPNSLHEGLLKAKHLNIFKFAIMWENRQSGGVSSRQDLLHNLLPFWIDNYFKNPSYLRVNGSPVLFIYGPEILIQDLGGVGPSKEALDDARVEMHKLGFPGMLVFCEDHGPDLSVMARNRAAGCDVQFAYAVGPPWEGTTATGASRTQLPRPTPEQVIAWQSDYRKAWKKKGDIPFITTASMGWDPIPWQNTNGPDYLQPEKMTRWRLSPEQFQTLLQQTKDFMATMPEGSLGNKMLLLDNWNEWAEGHFIAPHAAGGFGYLKAVREVFTRRDNKPDYRSPFELGSAPFLSLESRESNEAAKPVR